MTKAKRELILNHNQVSRIIKRIAFQILEDNFDQKEIIFVGIKGRGYFLAQEIFNAFKKIDKKVKPTLLKLEINKTDFDVPIQLETSNPKKLLNDKTIILVDDVLNSGEVMVHCVSHLLNYSVKRISSTVLINRNNPRFPVGVHYSGLSLSTTLDKYINVVIDNKDSISVYMH